MPASRAYRNRQKAARKKAAKTRAANKQQKTEAKRKQHNELQYAYAIRNRVLERMGFASYADYRKSELWASIRQRVFDRDGGRCRLCLMFAAEHIHHADYAPETLAGECLDGMLAVCGRCHYKIEFDQDGGKRVFKRALQSTNRRLLNADSAG